MPGLSDGRRTEIVSGRNIKEGMKVITSIENDDADNSNKNEVNAFRFRRGL